MDIVMGWAGNWDWWDREKGLEAVLVVVLSRGESYRTFRVQMR